MIETTRAGPCQMGSARCCGTDHLAIRHTPGGGEHGGGGGGHAQVQPWRIAWISRMGFELWSDALSKPGQAFCAPLNPRTFSPTNSTEGINVAAGAGASLSSSCSMRNLIVRLRVERFDFSVRGAWFSNWQANSQEKSIPLISLKNSHGWRLGFQHVAFRLHYVKNGVNVLKHCDCPFHRRFK